MGPLTSTQDVFVEIEKIPPRDFALPSSSVHSQTSSLPSTQKARVLWTNRCYCCCRYWLWVKETWCRWKKKNVKKLEQLNLTRPNWQVSHLTINKPLPTFSFLLAFRLRLGALHICEKLIISQSGAAGCLAACQPQEEWKKMVLFSRGLCWEEDRALCFEYCVKWLQ